MRRYGKPQQFTVKKVSEDGNGSAFLPDIHFSLLKDRIITKSLKYITRTVKTMFLFCSAWVDCFLVKTAFMLSNFISHSWNTAVARSMIFPGEGVDPWFWASELWMFYFVMEAVSPLPQPYSAGVWWILLTWNHGLEWIWVPELLELSECPS